MRTTAMDFLCKGKEALRTTWQRNPNAPVLFGLIAFVCLVATQPDFAQMSSQAASTAVQAVDPNKGPSELNHHIAGWALIAVGILELVSLLSPQRRAHRYLWPALFVLAGIYLALWSDGEIWPRGNLNWSWLFQHDSEARQHKIYSVLLGVIGIVEYVRISGSLPRFWKMWAFPVLVVLGSGLLLIHDHTSGSGVRSPEAKAYLVNPALDVDGSVPKPNVPTIADATPEDPHPDMHHLSENAMDGSAVDSNSMPMNHSQMATDVSNTGHTHHHVMTASMLRVEREHMWFIVVGLAIGVFKFISDGEFFRSRIVPYMWPGCMVLLGFMLVFYRE